MTLVLTASVLAALPPWAAALVWILAILGAAVFVYRRITGSGRPDQPPPDASAPADLLGPSDPGVPSGAPAPSAFFVDPTGDRPGIPLAPDAPADLPAVPGPSTPAVSPTPSASTGPASTSSSDRTGYFARGGAAPAPGEPDAGPSARRLTVAEALRGITMPCGLSPVIDGSVSIPNPFRVAFLTTTSDAATVGSSVGDELERLGYQLSTATATEVVARKPGVELHVVLYPNPATATRGLDQLFPVAPAGSVGVEFSS
jgi:hypothetical protein